MDTTSVGRLGAAALHVCSIVEIVGQLTVLSAPESLTVNGVHTSIVSQPEGEEALTNSYNYGSNRFIEKGDYFRIKDITLSYQLPQTILNKVGLKSTRVYASGLNVYTFQIDDFRGVGFT